MDNLFLATASMMALTFAIGFVVAGVIKLVAYMAEYFEFYNLHHEELSRLKKIQKLQWRDFRFNFLRMSLKKSNPDYELSNYYKGISDEKIDPEDADKYYHETSSGMSDFSLMDYYYPSESRIKIVQHNSELEKQQNEKNKK